MGKRFRLKVANDKHNREQRKLIFDVANDLSNAVDEIGKQLFAVSTVQGALLEHFKCADDIKAILEKRAADNKAKADAKKAEATTVETSTPATPETEPVTPTSA